MWTPIGQREMLLLRDQHYDNLESQVVNEELGEPHPDGTKYFKHRFMVWKFKNSSEALVAVLTKDNINYFYKWEKE
jgi:hypothetical protein